MPKEFKICVVCKRRMTWRRKWARTWDQVKYCSEACRKKSGKSVSPDLRRNCSISPAGRNVSRIQK